MKRSASFSPGCIANFRSLKVKTSGFVILFGLIFISCISAAAQGEEALPRPHLRKAILESFPYEPGIRIASDPEPAPAQVFSSELDSEVILLPEFEISTRALDRRVTQAIDQSRASSAPPERKLGTGVLTKDFGKVRVGVMTILYVPIQIGISW